jgi:hypothetical protein
MSRRPPPHDAPPDRTLGQHVDAEDLRNAISAALDAPTVDVRALRQTVWTYVDRERQLGMPPGPVIVALTMLVEGSGLPRGPHRDETLRDVVLWCVEAYFGQLRGDAKSARVE